MRKLSVAAVALVLLGSSCLGGASDERTVLVDFSHDEFASIMVDYFPGEIDVTPGMTLVFKQTWTGEPHTVTAGTLVNEMMSKAEPWSRFFGAFGRLEGSGANLPNPERPEGSAADLFAAVEAVDDDELKNEFFDAYDGLVEMGLDLPERDDPGDASFASVARTIDSESERFFEDLGLPWALDETEEGGYEATQNAGQPCYLDDGGPPEEADTPCRDAQQVQPVFDGTASYYNSGIIPYEGPGGNTFRVELAPDIEPGSYFFYCAVHGPDQATEVNVRPEGSEIPPQTDVSRRARGEIAEFVEPMLGVFQDAQDGEIEMAGETVEGPFAGLSAPVFGAINEFLPRTLRVDVGQEVTWKMMGWGHTITFGVPEYFPIVRFAEGGEVALNPRLAPPAGGSGEIPEQEDMGILRVGGGTYDGDGFFSSGLISSVPYAEYTLRFSEPGRYRYACLLHPPMVGTVEVT